MQEKEKEGEWINKGPTVWLDGTTTPPKCVITQSDNAFSRLADFFLLLNTPNIHGGFIDKKISFWVYKVSKIGVMLRSFFWPAIWSGVCQYGTRSPLSNENQPMRSLVN